MSKKKLVVLSGAGISKESGIATFRGGGGLWEGYDIMDVASLEGWTRDFKQVLDFYNARRREIENAKPNEAHFILSELENFFDIQIVTQNIDNLHEQAGSTQVVHLHGDITKACSSNQKRHVKEIGYRDILAGQVCKDGYQLRPFIVWFGEEVPLIPAAIAFVSKADIVLVIGTSLKVYPAAGLVDLAKEDASIYVIDPERISGRLLEDVNVVHIQEKATSGMKIFKRLMDISEC